MGKPFTKKQTKIKKISFLDKFEAGKGNISIACKSADIGRTTYYEWTNPKGDYYDAEFTKKVEDIMEGTGDFVESKLIQKINKDDITAIIFYCKTKLKARGYVERSEITGKDEQPLNPSATIILTEDAIKATIKKLNDEF